MPNQLPFGRRVITYSSAVRKNHNMLNELDSIHANKRMYADLWAQRELIEALVRYHFPLGKQDACRVLDPQEWIQGAFNVCVLVEVAPGGMTTRLVFRCPKPHRLAGMVDEKLSSEVGAYVWMQEKCPDIRIPHLFGFGFSDGRQVRSPPFYSHLLLLMEEPIVHPLNAKAVSYPHSAYAMAFHLLIVSISGLIPIYQNLYSPEYSDTIHVTGVCRF